MDPREELILKLQREMNLIKQENVFLRNQLQFPQREKPRFPVPDPTTQGTTIYYNNQTLTQIQGLLVPI